MHPVSQYRDVNVGKTRQPVLNEGLNWFQVSVGDVMVSCECLTCRSDPKETGQANKITAITFGA